MPTLLRSSSTLGCRAYPAVADSVRQPSLSRQCVARGLMYLRPSCPEPGLK
jgi:hypothetical protein